MILKKHAYCIIAHNEPEIFKILVSLIDHPLNDIYVHIDKRVNNIDDFRIETKHSNIQYLNIRRKVYWGDMSILDVEVDLIKKALSNGQYQYFHIISGVDLPIKKQSDIHAICDSLYPLEFIGVADDAQYPWIEERINFYHLFHKSFRKPNSTRYKISKSFVRIQKKLAIKRNAIPFSKMGPNWCSITCDFAKYITEEWDRMRRRYRLTLISDECFFQTCLCKSKQRFSANSLESQYDSCKRLIDWNRGNPYTWREVDFIELINSDSFFARKFSSTDIAIAKLLESYLRE